MSEAASRAWKRHERRSAAMSEAALRARQRHERGRVTSGAVYWAKHAWLPEGVRERVRLGVGADGLVSSISPDTDPEDGDRRLPGIVLPGFANAHSHAFHRALRGRTHGDGGSFWTWRERMYAVAGRLDPDSYLALARATYAEMALAGVTAVGEFHYLHHAPGGSSYTEPNVMAQALRQAAAEAGIRLTLLDTCYLAGGLTADGYTPLAGVQRRFGDGDVDGWAARVAQLKPSAGMRIGTAVHSVRAVPRDQLARIGAAVRSVRAVPSDQLTREDAQLPGTGAQHPGVGARLTGADAQLTGIDAHLTREDAQLNGVGAQIAGMTGVAGQIEAPLHVHLSEQPAENDACQAFHGLSPTALLATEGLLGPRTTAVHATHLSVDDVRLLGSAASTACFCPTTERDLADGIGPARDLFDAGVGLALGSDQHAIIDLLEEARALELHERLASNQRGRFAQGDLLDALTWRGHASIGWPELGRIAVGSPADLVAVRLDSVRTSGSRPDQVVMSASAADVDTVLVGGREIVRGGVHILGDVGSLLSKAISPLVQD